MNNGGEAEFDIRHFEPTPWDADQEGERYDPRCGVAIRAGGVWIPGEDIYTEAPEVSFWIEQLLVLKNLIEGSDKEEILLGGGRAISFEKINSDKVRVMNHYSEESIEDESERLGIEKTGVCSIIALSKSALEWVQRIIDHVRNNEPTRWHLSQLHLLENRAQKLDWLLR
ncbi:hypothetical protein [Haloferax sp. DFSO60]|uniref:hypothetical protein n=1 Tax=Haloferax sp. DFSO60 TaxID=3388652 RepID=UPI00397B6E8E